MHLGLLGKKQPKVDITVSLLRLRGANENLLDLRMGQLMHKGLLGKLQPKLDIPF